MLGRLPQVPTSLDSPANAPQLLWLAEARPASLFPDETMQPDASPRCRRETIQPMSRTDWMEWQAGYTCGAFLMPLTHIKGMYAEYRVRRGWSEIPDVGRDHAGASSPRSPIVSTCRQTRLASV